MLSEKSTATVRATLPAVGAAIGEITELFYTKLFAAHPALIRDLFNRGNQNAGLQKQALAGSIAAFAVHLVEHPDTRPDVMLGRIAHKHASLGVTREQYAVVHEHLFAAIAEILGEAVTPEVAQAWDEVYWLMAGALVAIEERLYAEQQVTAGDVWREWTVTGRVEETADCTTFRLTPADGAPAPAFKPGQYVSVQVELPDGARQIRQYSLSSPPGSPVRAITVKRVRTAVEAGHDTLVTFGGAYSNHLRATAAAGRLLGLRTVGVVRGDELAGRPLNDSLARCAADGMRLHFVSRSRYRAKADPQALALLLDEAGASGAYAVPEGGSNALALAGCAELGHELRSAADVVAVACGTGGTLAGLAAGLAPGQRALGVPVLAGGFLSAEIRSLQTEAYGGPVGDWSLAEDFHHGGYARVPAVLEAFAADFESRHGLPVERIYVAKLLWALTALTASGTFPHGTTLAAIITGRP